MRLHRVYLGPDKQVYIDDKPLNGVQSLNLHYEVDSHAVVEIHMLIESGPPTLEDINMWTKERAVREEEWKEMMTKKAQELLDGLS